MICEINLKNLFLYGYSGHMKCIDNYGDKIFKEDLRDQ